MEGAWEFGRLRQRWTRLVCCASLRGINTLDFGSERPVVGWTMEPVRIAFGLMRNKNFLEAMSGKFLKNMRHNVVGAYSAFCR
jgi:hypothetical protein